MIIFMEDSSGEADLHRIPINSVIYQQYIKMNEEFSDELRINGPYTKGQFPEMAIFEQMARSQARGFADILSSYDSKVADLNFNYGDPYLHHWEIGIQEARERKELLENLAYDLGLTRTDERPEPVKRDIYSFTYDYDGRQIVYDLFKKRLRENRNLIILFSGKVGGGKSYGSLSVADYLTPDMRIGYDLSSMVYSIEEFIEAVKTLPPGETIIMDEAGISAGNRDTMTRESKALGKVIQSIRYLQHCSIFSLPNINFLDKSIRLMIDIIFDHTEDQRQGEFSPYIPVLTDDGKDINLMPLTKGNTIIRSVYFPLPRPSLIADYEKKRRTHNMKQLEDLQNTLIKKDRRQDENQEREDRRGKNPNSLKNLIQNRRE